MTELKENNNNKKLMDHLKNEDFFDVVNHPTATLTFTNALPTANPREFLITADLTIKGITNPVEFTAQFNEDMTAAQTTFDIDRTLWNIRYGSPSFFNDLGDNAISNTISFTVSVSFE